MKWGCGTLFWLQPLSGHCRPSPAAASPVSQRSCRYHCCPAACRLLLENSDSVFFMVTLVRWLQRAWNPYIYARPSVIRNLHVLKWETELHTQALKILCRYAVKRCV